MTKMNAKLNQNEAIFTIYPIIQTNYIEPDVEPKARQSLWTIAAIIVVCLIGGIIIGSFISTNGNKQYDKYEKDVIVSDPVVKGCNRSLEIVTRTGWKARKTNNAMNKLQLPAPLVIIAHTATDHCSSREDCAFMCQQIQNFHINSRKWLDIGYNFLIGGDGKVYTGRGWDFEGSHTLKYNAKSIGIAFIGSFKWIAPTENQLCAAKKLIAEGLLQKKISTDYQLFGHCQLRRTDSPGQALYDVIKTWDHWTLNVIS